MTVVTTAEHGLEEGERQAERDLGAVIAKVEALEERFTEHTTTIEGLKGDGAWMKGELEAMKRDLLEIPRVPSELASTIEDSLAGVTHRLERLEASTTGEDDETNPPEKENDDETESEPELKSKHGRQGLLNLDNWF